MSKLRTADTDTGEALVAVKEEVSRTNGTILEATGTTRAASKMVGRTVGDGVTEEEEEGAVVDAVVGSTEANEREAVEEVEAGTFMEIVDLQILSKS